MTGTPLPPISMDSEKLTSTKSCGQFFDFYRPWLLRLAVSGIDPVLRTKVSASDMVQKTYLRAWQCIHQFEGKSANELRGWLATIMKHQLADSARRYQGVQKRDVYRELHLSDCDQLPARVSENWPGQETIERLILAIDLLPEEERAIVRQRYLEQQSFEAIAAHCNMSRERVRRRWLSAIDKLARQLNESSGNE